MTEFDDTPIDAAVHAAQVRGLLAAALVRPPAWEGADALPTAGAVCAGCQGSQWERTATGWRCVWCAG